MGAYLPLTKLILMTNQLAVNLTMVSKAESPKEQMDFTSKSESFLIIFNRLCEQIEMTHVSIVVECAFSNPIFKKQPCPSKKVTQWKSTASMLFI